MRKSAERKDGGLCVVHMILSSKNSRKKSKCLVWLFGSDGFDPSDIIKWPTVTSHAEISISKMIYKKEACLQDPLKTRRSRPVNSPHSLQLSFSTRCSLTLLSILPICQSKNLSKTILLTSFPAKKLLHPILFTQILSTTLQQTLQQTPLTKTEHLRLYRLSHQVIITMLLVFLALSTCNSL